MIILWLPFKWGKNKVCFSLINKFYLFTNYSIINIEFLYFITFISLPFLTKKLREVSYLIKVSCMSTFYRLWGSFLMTQQTVDKKSWLPADIEFFEAILFFIVFHSCTVSLTGRRRFVILSFHHMKSFCRVISPVLSSASTIIWNLSLRKQR